MKAIIEFKPGLTGCQLKNGKNTLDWNELTKEEQRKVIDGLMDILIMFGRFYNQKYETD